MHVIGEDRSERLDVIPARYQVICQYRLNFPQKFRGKIPQVSGAPGIW
jgi:transposase